MTTLTLNGRDLRPESLAFVADDTCILRLDPDGIARMKAARVIVDDAVERRLPVYGVTTGLGAKATEALPPDDLVAFSYQTVRGRAQAIGPPLPDRIVRAAMAVRLNTLLRGAAGASPDVAEHLLSCLNANLTPIIGEEASLGAGDLVWGATMALALIGEGRMRSADGTVADAKSVMEAANLTPLKLRPRDGLALANHASFSAALAALAVAEATIALEAAQTAVALSMEGFRANLTPFAPLVLAAKPQPGQQRAADGLLRRLEGSGLHDPGSAHRLQDPLSIRNVPQTHGSTFAALDFARTAAVAEINGASDNPVVCQSEGVILSSGAYHTTHLTITLEALTRALAHVAMMLLARTSKMVSSRFTDLPLFLAQPQSNSNGFAPLLKTAEALSVSLMHKAQPVPIWPSVSADGVEDCMTAAPIAGRILLSILQDFRHLVAIELVIAAQAVELRGLAPGEIAPALAAITAQTREISPALIEDRPLGDEIEALAAAIKSGAFGPPQA